MKARILGLALVATIAMPAAHGAVMQFDFTATGADGRALNIMPVTYTLSTAYGDRTNVSTVYRDESYVWGNTRHVYHYADTSYDQTRSYNDYLGMSLEGAAASAQEFVYFKGTASYDPTRLPTNASLNAFAFIYGTYTPRTNPLFPNVKLLPGAPTIAMAQSTNPADLVSESSAVGFDKDGTFNAGVTKDMVLSDAGTIDLGILLYGNAGLNVTSYSIYLTGYTYLGTEHFTESQYLGFEILPVPEPSTWAMLLAGVGILGIARRRKNAA